MRQYNGVVPGGLRAQRAQPTAPGMDSSQKRARGTRSLRAGGALLAAVIFALDLQVPGDSDVGMLYVLVILLGLWTDSRSYPIVAAGVVTGLLLTAAAIHWPGAVPASVQVNRPLMILLFAIAAALVDRFNRLQRQEFAHVGQLADLKRAFDHAAIVATTDVSGRITYANDKFCEISGYARDELLGQDHRIVNSGYHSKEFMRDLWRTIANGDVWHGEIRNRAKDGHYYWVDTTIVPFINERGKPYQYIAIRADISARKAAEDRLTQQAALAQVGQLAAVVAHEVRNPLAGIKGAMQILMSRRDAASSELPVMRDIVARIDALSELINDLMVFARPRQARLGPVELRSLVSEAMIVARRDPASQLIDFAVHGETAPITGDEELIRAAVLNLLINAAQAMSGQGRIDVTIARRNDMAVVEVKDTGPGIPDAIRERVFEPFYTTKARGGGLGLPIAKRTAELHGGTLSLACPPEGGTVVSITLPARTRKEAATPSA